MHFDQLIKDWTSILFFGFCLTTLIQVFYFLFFFIRLAFYKQQSKNQNQTHAVSIIICARDEAANLATNLPGVLVQEYPSTHEVIVVNDNSFDESKYILAELKKTFKQLQVVELTQEAQLIPGKKFPLAVGLKTAKYEIVLLTDADCVPASEHWIESMQNSYNNDTEVVLGYGAFHKQKGFFNKLVRWECFTTALQYMSYALAGMPYMGVGRNLSYKKTLFFKNKGFAAHNQIPGGDDDLFINAVANKQNTKINIDPESFTLSNPARNWQQWMNQKKRHYSTGKYYKKSHQFFLGLYSLSQFLFYPLLIAACIFFDWKYCLIPLGVRLILQAIVYYKTMNKLNEKDLFPFFILFDIWMFFYYIIFFPAVLKKPKNQWK